MNVETGRSEILVTGNAGYIGNHAVVALVDAGYAPVVVDNLSSSKEAVLDRVAAITGRTVPFIASICAIGLRWMGLFEAHAIAAVIHTAGLKAVGNRWPSPCGTTKIILKGRLRSVP